MNKLYTIAAIFTLLNFCTNFGMYTYNPTQCKRPPLNEPVTVRIAPEGINLNRYIFMLNTQNTSNLSGATKNDTLNFNTTFFMPQEQTKQPHAPHESPQCKKQPTGPISLARYKAKNS